MIRLLVSVRDAWEAWEAAAGGADVIDVKEPRLGSLGAASPDTWNAVRLSLNSPDSVPCRLNSSSRPSVLLSAALGELLEYHWTATTSQLHGYTYAKVGLAGCGTVDNWEQRWRDWIANLPPETAPVAVIYADYKSAVAPVPWRVIEAASRTPARTLLVDTYDKTAGNLFQRIKRGELMAIIATAHAAGFQVALAGSITQETLADAVGFLPDWIAVRGAVCRGGRESILERELVERIAKHLSTPRGPDVAAQSNAIIDSVPGGA